MFTFIISVLAPSWAKVSGQLKQLDISPSDVVWGVNSLYDTWLRVGTTWKRVTGDLKHVSVGNAGVWGVNQWDYVYFREDVTPRNLDGTSWTRVVGENILLIFFLFVSGRNPSLFCNLIRCSSGRNFTISDHGPKVILFYDKSRSKSKFQN